MEKISRLKHLFVTVFLSNFAFNVVTPAITDITMDAICPSQDKCSLAIYLSGFQQAIIGLGSMLMMPLIGNLSDVYGRKTLLTIPVTLLIFPSVIMAYRRTTNYFYAYYVMRTLTGMLSDTGIQCISIAYAADCMSEENRASAIATLAGVGSAAFLCSNFVVRFLSTAQIFLLILLPKLARIIREETILSLALIAGFSNMLIDSIAWAAWVPYVVALFPMFFFLAKPALQSIVSKQVGPNEQGIAQGCLSGVGSFANILSPFIFSPLTDLFLSERAPFDYPGFSMLCIGLAWLIAIIPSMMISWFGTYNSRHKIRDVLC